MEQPKLGKMIAELRKSKGMTQDELVQRCNLSVRTLQRIESGEVVPRVYTIKAIFAALECDIQFELPNTVNGNDDVAPLVMTKSWIKTSTSGLFDFFNLKKNTMTKLSILSVATLAALFFAFNKSTHAQSIPQNPLVGTWQLVSSQEGSTGNTEIIQALSSNGLITVINQLSENDTSRNRIAPRTLKFTVDNKFQSLVYNETVYNSGVYACPTDNSLVTVHYQRGTTLADVANLYTYKIENDTLLHFYGYYIEPLSCADKLCQKAYINEWWVKVNEQETQSQATTQEPKQKKKKKLN